MPALGTLTQHDDVKEIQMSTKKSSQKAALNKAKAVEVKVAVEKKSAVVCLVKNCAKALAQSAVGKWATTTVKQTAFLCASVATTTVAFGAMMEVTLLLDEHWLHHVFEALAEVEPVLGTMFKLAKYAAVAAELYFWVKGVYLNCKEHSTHKHTAHDSTTVAEVVPTVVPTATA